MKKTLAILLSLALVICMIPGTAFAADTTGLVVALTKSSVPYDGNAHTATVASAKYNGQAINDLQTVTTTDETTFTDVGEHKIKYSYTPEGGSEATYEATFKIEALDISKVGLIYDFTDSDFETNGALKTGLSIKATIGTLEVTNMVTITGQKNGTNAAITVTNNSANLSGEKKELTVEVKKTLNDAVITFTKPSGGAYEYTGKEIIPAFTVKTAGGTSLKVNNHYTIVKYENNVEAGSYPKVTIAGTGEYAANSGTSKSSEYKIDPKSITKCTITAADVAKGSPAEITVKDGTKVLVENYDYTVTVPSTDVAVGSQVTATIKGYNNYDESKTVNFKVVDPSNEIKNDNTEIYVEKYAPDLYETYCTGVAQKPSVAVYVNNVMISSSSYTVEYTDNTDPGTATVTITGKYPYHGTASTTFKIKETPITYGTISGVSSSYAYTGMPITPTVTLHVEGKLVPASNYKVTIRNNTNVSTSSNKATVTVEAIGKGYTGSCSTTFTIVAKNISACTTEFVGGKSTVAYTGSVVTPDVTVRDGYKVLSRYSDYSVTYTDPAGKTVTTIKDAGTYTVNITGKGNYTGTKTMTFNVTGTDISKYTVTLKTATVAANGKVQNPVVSSVTYGTTSKLTTNDYTISYQDADGKTVTSITAPGTYKVIATGKNGYSGNAVATYKVTGKAQSVKVTKDYYSIYETSDIFKISATATGDGTGFTYKSSDPTVAYVSSTGVVTPVKPGYTVITVSTTGTKLYEPAKETVSVKVAPAKATLSKKPWTGGEKNQLKVRWDYEGNATKYQVRYSTSKSFSTYKSKTVKAHGKDYTTQSTTIKNLTGNKTYYVKVRAIYETVDENGEKVTCYGKWSNWKSGKTK